MQLLKFVFLCICGLSQEKLIKSYAITTKERLRFDFPVSKIDNNHDKLSSEHHYNYVPHKNETDLSKQKGNVDMLPHSVTNYLKQVLKQRKYTISEEDASRETDEEEDNEETDEEEDTEETDEDNTGSMEEMTEEEDQKVQQCPTNGNYPDLNSCKSYHICRNGISIKIHCHEDSLYNPRYEKCTKRSATQKCFKFNCNGRGNTKVTYDGDRNIFASCCRNKPTEILKCPNGMVFHEKVQICITKWNEEKTVKYPPNAATPATRPTNNFATNAATANSVVSRGETSTMLARSTTSPIVNHNSLPIYKPNISFKLPVANITVSTQATLIPNVTAQSTNLESDKMEEIYSNEWNKALGLSTSPYPESLLNLSEPKRTTFSKIYNVTSEAVRVIPFNNFSGSLPNSTTPLTLEDSTDTLPSNGTFHGGINLDAEISNSSEGVISAVYSIAAFDKSLEMDLTNKSATAGWPVTENVSEISKPEKHEINSQSALCSLDSAWYSGSPLMSSLERFTKRTVTSDSSVDKLLLASKDNDTVISLNDDNPEITNGPTESMPSESSSRRDLSPRDHSALAAALPGDYKNSTNTQSSNYTGKFNNGIFSVGFERSPITTEEAPYNNMATDDPKPKVDQTITDQIDQWRNIATSGSEIFQSNTKGIDDYIMQPLSTSTAKNDAQFSEMTKPWTRPTVDPRPNVRSSKHMNE